MNLAFRHRRAFGHSRRQVTALALSAWSMMYTAPHIYWALGGDRGFFLLRPEAVAFDEWEAANAAASVVLMLPVGIGIGLVRFWARARVRVALLGAALAGASIAGAHGLYGIVYRILNLAGVVEVEGQKATVSEHPWVLWDLLIFEPWFVIEGVLFAAMGWTATTTQTTRRWWVFACVAGISLATLTGLLGLRFA